MSSKTRLSNNQLASIIDEATIYMCACPAQVAEQILRLREMIRYQADCEAQAGADSKVHKTIAAAGERALAVLEACLDDVLDIEGWDRTTLKMPPGLRKRRDEMV
ncbi:MAG: hypothetical protein HYU59_05570 [Magnetospirillum gryphiswaldense]|nr:hypothetical protein [Magnetospirillum gryphiswaldense]